MKKKYIILTLLSASVYMKAQVGINNESPNSTLDVVAGSENTSNDIEGVLVPRVSINKALLMGRNSTAIQESTLIYVNELTDSSVPSGGTNPIIEKINANGFYSWNGSQWIKHLTGDEGSKWINDPAKSTVSLKKLSNGTTTRTVEANLFVKDNGRVGIGKDTPLEKLDVLGNIYFGVGKDENGAANDYIRGKNGGVAYRYTFPPNRYDGGNWGNYYLANAGPSTSTNPNTTFGLAIGSRALTSLTSGNNNVTVGYSSLEKLESGSYNTIIGSQTARRITEANRNIIIGGGAIPITASTGSLDDNIVVGASAFAFTEGTQNIAVGTQTMRYSSSGNNNVVLGHQIPLPYTQNGDNQLSINNWITGKDGLIGIGPKYVSTYINPPSGTITIGTQATITERLEVDGNIKVGGTGAAITDGAACTNNGTISYAADGNFYGCTGNNVWKKLNN